MTSGSIRKLALLLAFLFGWGQADAATSAAARVESWSTLSSKIFDHLGPQNGLPNSQVNSATQDGDGFLWVGTPTGLARWDGYRFRSYIV